MRTTKDRIRHALAFEIVALVISIPLASLVFGYEAHKMGVVAIFGSVTATVWSYIYNIWFDKAMLKWRGNLQKSVTLRVLHAILFEVGLSLIFLPPLAWYLNIGIWEALMMDIAMSLFYVVYAFFFNWAYDKLFPIPSTADSTAK